MYFYLTLDWPLGRLTAEGVHLASGARVGSRFGVSFIVRWPLMARVKVDPLLPIRVQRSVAERAALLAPLLLLSYQHVRGALDIFWEGLADRRLLDAPAVILLESGLRARLRLAFGCEVDPELLVQAGFLERRAAGFRVRGMSAYIEPEMTRRARTGRRKEVPDAVRTVPVVGAAGLPPVLPPPGVQERRAPGSPMRGQVGGRAEDPVRPPEAAPAPAARTGPAVEFAVWAQVERRQELPDALTELPPWKLLEEEVPRALALLGGDLERLEAAWCRYLRDDWALARAPACPWAPFLRNIARYVPGQWRSPRREQERMRVRL